MSELKPHLKLVNFKASPEEHEAWKEAAHVRRTTFSKWAREQLNRGLGSSTVEPPVVIREDAGATPVPAPDEKLKVARELMQRAASKKGSCEKRLPKGAFCKGCGRIHG